MQGSWELLRILLSTTTPATSREAGDFKIGGREASSDVSRIIHLPDRPRQEAFLGSTGVPTELAIEEARMSALRLDSVAREFRESGENAAMLARLTRDLPRVLRAPISPDEAQERLHRRLASREQRLLTVVQRAIYGYPRSPYLKLLRHAACELGDFRALLAREGIEGTLTMLADQGVYVTYDEIKGRRAAVRGSQRFSFRERDFDNPFLRSHLILYTGGSGRRPSRVGYSLAFLEEWAGSISLAIQAHGVDGPRQAFWWPVPLAHMIMAGMLGHPAIGWFYPVHPLPAIALWVARYVAMVGRLAGCRFPPPERGDLERPERLAGWLAKHLDTGRPVVVWATPSAGARLGIAARQAGLDLRGATLLVGGEAVTEARRRQMEASGARVIAVYSSIDVSAPAYGCATPTAADDLHAMLDRSAIIRRPRPATAAGPIVDALLVTALSPAVPRIALNCETGDYARLEERDCGCLLGALGLRTHLSEIRSFEKLTGEGVTFARTNLQQILEEVLPARFGGTSLDYQLAEEEAPNGATRLVLRVSPSVGEVDEAGLRAALLTELGRGGLSEQYHVGLWRGVGSIEIRRESPLTTRAGKVLPFQLLQHTRGE